eukprot:TRINITY_DN2047_c0_g2_i1.p5 TRINITY_DN2047_c0_g2~~TRINITY_DN2047_c0_g2_i1.p5  ORF type:complete len:51 (-),score=4.58 TRINITY_DN2047_c0_g2_i1:209-361(-)
MLKDRQHKTTVSRQKGALSRSCGQRHEHLVAAWTTNVCMCCGGTSLSIEA